MRYVTHIVRTKGCLSSFGRMFQIFRRFLFGRRRFEKMLDSLENGASLQGTKITFCVTASLLDRHKGLIERITRIGHELAGHGYYHSNMKAKNRSEQDEIVRSCYEKFLANGFRIRGFRCPYLSYNDDTTDVLRYGPYSWVSNDIIYWQNGICTRCSNTTCFKRLSHIYNSARADESPSLPRVSEGKIDIPISGPEDEMLVERCGLKDPAEISDIWLAMLDRIYERGELFHLIFHPERFAYVLKSFRDLVKSARAKDPPVWIASLDEIADWWRERNKTLWHFEKSESGDRTLWIEAPENATILAMGDDCGRDGKGAIYRHYVKIDPIGARDGSLGYSAGSADRKPAIGISMDTDGSVEKFLWEEGFFVERSADREKYSFYIHRLEPFEEKDKLPLLERIDNSGKKLFRIWRWPRGARSAFALSSDVDAITIRDFAVRALMY